MSFMCTAGSSTATVKSGPGQTAATDNAAGATGTANQFAAANADPSLTLGVPQAPTLQDSLVQSAQARVASQLLDNSRSQAFGNAPAGSATGRISLLG